MKEDSELLDLLKEDSELLDLLKEDFELLDLLKEDSELLDLLNNINLVLTQVPEISEEDSRIDFDELDLSLIIDADKEEIEKPHIDLNESLSKFYDISKLMSDDNDSWGNPYIRLGYIDEMLGCLIRIVQNGQFFQLYDLIKEYFDVVEKFRLHYNKPSDLLLYNRLHRNEEELFRILKKYDYEMYVFSRKCYHEFNECSEIGKNYVKFFESDIYENIRNAFYKINRVLLHLPACMKHDNVDSLEEALNQFNNKLIYYLEIVNQYIKIL